MRRSKFLSNIWRLTGDGGAIGGGAGGATNKGVLSGATNGGAMGGGAGCARTLATSGTDVTWTEAMKDAWKLTKRILYGSGEADQVLLKTHGSTKSKSAKAEDAPDWQGMLRKIVYGNGQLDQVSCPGAQVGSRVGGAGGAARVKGERLTVNRVEREPEKQKSMGKSAREKLETLREDLTRSSKQTTPSATAKTENESNSPPIKKEKDRMKQVEKTIKSEQGKTRRLLSTEAVSKSPPKRKNQIQGLQTQRKPPIKVQQSTPSLSIQKIQTIQKIQNNAVEKSSMQELSDSSSGQTENKSENQAEEAKEQPLENKS